jgi:hypothetical protein
MYDGRKLDIQFTQSQISSLNLDELKELSTFARGSRKYSPRVIALSWDARVSRVNADTQDWLLDIIAMKEDDPRRILAKLSPAKVEVVYEIPGTNMVAWLDGSPSHYSPKVCNSDEYRFEGRKTPLCAPSEIQKNDILINEMCPVELKTEEKKTESTALMGDSSSTYSLNVPNAGENFMENCYVPVDGVIDAQRKAVLVDEFYSVELDPEEKKVSVDIVDGEHKTRLVSRDRICSYLEKDPETSHLLDVLVSHDEGVGCDFFEESLSDGNVKVTQVRHLDQPVLESTKVLPNDQVSKMVVDFYKKEKDKMLSSLPLKGRDLNRHTVVPKIGFGVAMGDLERIAHLYFGRDQLRHCARPFAATSCNVSVRGKDFFLEFSYHGVVKARSKYGPFSVGNVDYREDTYLLLAIVQSMESFFFVRRMRPVPILIHHNNTVNYGICYQCSKSVFKTSYPWYICVKCQKPRATCDLIYEDMVIFRFPPSFSAKTIFVSQRYEGCNSSYFLNLRHFSSSIDARDYTRLLRLCYDFIQRCRPYSLLWCLSCPGVLYRQLINDLRRVCRIEVPCIDGSFDYDKFPGMFPHKGLAPDIITWLARVSVPPSSAIDSSLVAWSMENDLSANFYGMLASTSYESSG